jgi:hypothetical protein
MTPYSGRHRRPVPTADPFGYPVPGHPESLSRSLPEAAECWLISVAAVLWPAGEYLQIRRDPPAGGLS